MTTSLLLDRVGETWDKSILPVLHDYIRIPNKSPAFDPDWQAAGHMERALTLLTQWCEAQAVPGASLSVERLPGRTPLILIDLPGNAEGGDDVLLYGHFDKQPETTGWRDGLGAWTPVIEGDRLYGRGSADDGYAIFASLTALRLLVEAGTPHGRIVILIEACEESGSFDLPAHLEALGERLGNPGLIVCLDSGCGNYDQLWVTTSLRGLVSGDLSVSLLTEGVHSGDGSGVIASSFRVLRRLLSRIEDETSGAILAPEFYVEIPAERVEQAKQLAGILGENAYRKFPLHPGVGPVTPDIEELVLNRTWRPALSVTGATGLPPLDSAGNVLRPHTTVKLSMRIPPGCDADAATATLKSILESDPPYGARIHFEPDHVATGWNAPQTAPWLRDAVEDVSRRFFDREAAYMGEGGTIPFMAMLGERFPNAQFLVTGLLGPQSNAHGPNEFLHIPTAKKLTASVAEVLRLHTGAHKT